MFQWRRGQLGRRGAGVRKEWDRGDGRQVWVRRGEAGSQPSGPLLPGGPEERRKVWAGEKIQALGEAMPPIPWHQLPPNRCSPCLFLFKEQGRPISLLRAYLSCFLIFQSSDFIAFFCCLAPSPQQQEEPFPLLLDPLLGKHQLGQCWDLPCPTLALGTSKMGLGSHCPL